MDANAAILAASPDSANSLNEEAQRLSARATALTQVIDLRGLVLEAYAEMVQTMRSYLVAYGDSGDSLAFHNDVADMIPELRIMCHFMNEGDANCYSDALDMVAQKARLYLEYSDSVYEAVRTGCKDNVAPSSYLTVLKTMPYDEYLQTPHWQEVRQGARLRAQYRCQVCNSSEGSLHVHHRTYENRGDEQPQDVILLCATCHDLFHKNGRLAK